MWADWVDMWQYISLIKVSVYTGNPGLVKKFLVTSGEAYKSNCLLDDLIYTTVPPMYLPHDQSPPTVPLRQQIVKIVPHNIIEGLGFIGPSRK